MGRASGSTPKPNPKNPDSRSRGASQAAGADPTLRYGPAGDSAPSAAAQGGWYDRKVPFRPVPHGPNALRSGGEVWLAYRTFPLRAPLRLTWRQVYRQFGAHPDKASNKRTVDAFRTKVLRELKKIKLSWPGLNYTTAPGVLILHPSKPSIPNRQSNFSLWNHRGLR